MWVPPEDIDPILVHAPTRKSTAFFGAVRPERGTGMKKCIAFFDKEMPMEQKEMFERRLP